MKICIAVCTIYFLSTVSCGLISSPTLVRTPALDSVILRSNQLGGNFAYSTAENHGYVPTSSSVNSVVPLSYAIQQPLYPQQPIFAQPQVYAHQPYYSQQLVPQQFLGHSVLNSPLYSGLYPQGSIFAQDQALTQGSAFSGHFLPQLPSIAQLLPSQSPVFIQGITPVQGQAPVQGQPPVQGPVQEQSPIEQPSPSQPLGDAPASGATVDDDTVSIESA